jgi:hypothetical protein
MLSNKYLTFLFSIHCILAFVLPEAIQKPFKIVLGFFYLIIVIKSAISSRISSYKICLFLGIISIAVLISFNGSFQSSLLNLVLASAGIIYISSFNNISFDLKKFNFVYWLSFISIIIQFIIYESEDGRHKLSYELNLSGAFLFLFFCFSDLMDKKLGKYLVILLSFVLLSRLLMLSLLLYYLIKYLSLHKSKTRRIPIIIFMSVIYVSFFSFNFWFISTVEKGEHYNNTADRVTEINDGSNFLRFTANILVLNEIFLEKNPRFKLGYGNISDENNNFNNIVYIMPHNELLTACSEYGYILTILLIIFFIEHTGKEIKYSDLFIFIPVVVYTLILWVRFIIMPSFEMILLSFLIKAYRAKNISQYNSL